VRHGHRCFLAALVLTQFLACTRPAPARRLLPAKVDLAELTRTYGEPLYSQDDEETLIRAFFADRRGGFFLDVGAGAPIRHSTTYYLENHLGWSGIAVDAIAEYADAYARERPRTRFVSYFAGRTSDATHDFFVSDERNFSSGVAADPRGGSYQKRRVPTIALDDLLHREHVTSIDFLSLDVEGAEPEALAGLDLARYRPELACVEVGSPEVGHAVAERFALAGCREVSAYRAADAINRYYTCR
jgi:FkbM family methyltransferase